MFFYDIIVKRRQNFSKWELKLAKILPLCRYLTFRFPGSYIKCTQVWRFFHNLLTDTFVSTLIIAGTALVPPAVVCLHCLPVGRLVGDPERITQSNRAIWNLPWQEQEARHTGNESLLLLPMACASVGGPRVRAGLLCHVVIRMWVRLLHWSGEAEKQRKEISVIHLCGSVHHFVHAEIPQMMDGMPRHMCANTHTYIFSVNSQKNNGNQMAGC